MKYTIQSKSEIYQIYTTAVEYHGFPMHVESFKQFWVLIWQYNNRGGIYLQEQWQASMSS